ncbi:hypothetical protein LTR08_008991 [Meristemomyces frigidus]|nr:hypothetical protein LTR08_008991 [Meristemomyces frigidus]
MGNAHSGSVPDVDQCFGTTTAADMVSSCSNHVLVSASTVSEASGFSTKWVVWPADTTSYFLTAAVSTSTVTVVGRDDAPSSSSAGTWADPTVHDRVITVTLTTYETFAAGDAHPPTTLKTVAARSALPLQPDLPAESASTTSSTKISQAFPFASPITGLPSAGRIEEAVTTSTSEGLETLQITENGHWTTKTVLTTIVESEVQTATTIWQLTETTSSKHSSYASHDHKAPESSLIHTSYSTVTITPTETISTTGNSKQPSAYDTVSISGQSPWTSTFTPAETSAQSTINRVGEPAITFTDNIVEPTHTAKPTTTSSHPTPGADGREPQPAINKILPLNELWKHMDKHTVYAAYLIPLEIDAKEAVFAHLHELPKVTLGHASGTKESTTHADHWTTTHTTQHTSTSVVTFLATDSPTGQEPEVTSTALDQMSWSLSSGDSTTLNACEPATVTQLYPTVPHGVGHGPVARTRITTVSRTRDHPGGECHTIRSTEVVNPILPTSQHTMDKCKPKTTTRARTSMGIDGTPTAQTTTMTIHRTHAAETGACEAVQPTPPSNGTLNSWTRFSSTANAMATDAGAGAASTSDPFGDSWTTTASAPLAPSTTDFTDLVPSSTIDLATDSTYLSQNVSPPRDGSSATATAVTSFEQTYSGVDMGAPTEVAQ